MSPPSPRPYATTIGIVLLAAVALTVQLATNGPALGPFSLVVLTAPGFIITRAIGPRGLGWPRVVLTTLGVSLVLLVFTGMATAGSARGLSGSSVALVQLVALIAASAVWFWRVRRGEVRLELRVTGLKAGSVALLLLGVALGSVGFAVATGAARDQDSAARVLQFWSVTPSAAVGQVMGIRNATGTAVDCQVAIDRLGERIYESSIGALEDGETWTGPLPSSGGTGTAPWQLSLHCTAIDGSVFDRRLAIDPPA